MSREIKFRMWSGKVKKYFYDSDNVYGCLQNSKVKEWAKDYEDMVWQQFTGLKDKNGKEIYEGDVIRGYFDMGPAGMTINTAIVRWTNKEGYQWKYWDLNSIEVVGNIFENKDLVCDHTKYHMSVNGNCYNCGKLVFPKKPENGTPEHIKNIFKHNQ